MYADRLSNIATQYLTCLAFVQSCQSKDMDEKIKSYRQAIFKLDHAERKRGEAPASKEQCKLLTLTMQLQPYFVLQ